MDSNDAWTETHQVRLIEGAEWLYIRKPLNGNAEEGRNDGRTNGASMSTAEEPGGRKRAGIVTGSD